MAHIALDLKPHHEKEGNESVPSCSSIRQKTRLRRFTTQQIFIDTREVEILHSETIYKLRITAQGKLILTK